MISFRFNNRTQSHMFLLLHGHLVELSVPLRVSIYCSIKLHKLGKNISPNNARMKNRTDLRPVEVVDMSIIYYIPFS